jgi:hypothetical protein
MADERAVTLFFSWRAAEKDATQCKGIIILGREMQPLDRAHNGIFVKASVN